MSSCRGKTALVTIYTARLLNDLVLMVAKKLEDAESFAKHRHAHQIRKDGKTLYWVHLQQVVNHLKEIGINNDDILCAGWLHDTIEDTNTDFDDINENFGTKVAEIVAELTKNKRMPRKERETEYVTQLRNSSWQAQIIKLCDILANLADLPSSLELGEKKSDQVSNKLEYFDAIRNGLAKNREKFPNLDAVMKRLNEILKEYGKPPISV